MDPSNAHFYISFALLFLRASPRTRRIYFVTYYINFSLQPCAIVCRSQRCCCRRQFNEQLRLHFLTILFCYVLTVPCKHCCWLASSFSILNPHCFLQPHSFSFCVCFLFLGQNEVKRLWWHKSFGLHSLQKKSINKNQNKNTITSHFQYSKVVLSTAVVVGRQSVNSVLQFFNFLCVGCFSRYST